MLDARDPRFRGGRWPASTRSTRSTRSTLSGLLPLLLLVGLTTTGFTASPARAQTPAPEAGTPADPAETPTETLTETSATAESLAAEILAAYEVLPVRGGVVLQPLAAEAPFRSLEIADDGLAWDGEAIDESTLRERLGDAAEPILRWAALSPEERSRLLEQTASASQAPAAPGAPGAPEAEEPTEPEGDVVEEPPRTRTGDKVSLAGGVTIKENEIAQEIVVVAGPLRVNGEVEGGAIVVGGNAYIEGTVGRELMVVGGNVHLGQNAVVDGDINIMAGGRVYREPGAEVRGQINELGVIGPLFGSDDDRDFDFRPGFRPFRWFTDLMGQLFWLVTLGLLACLVVLFGQRAVEGVDETLAAEPWTSGAAGLLFQILFLPLLVIVILLLAISIIGIPLLLLLPFALLGLILAGFVGFVGVALRLGRVLTGRFGQRATGVYLPVVVGVVLLDIWMVLSQALDLPFLGFFSVLMMVMGILVQYAAWTFGSGALLLRVAARRRRRVRRPATVPPELPPTPDPTPEPGPDRSSDRDPEP